MRGLLIGGMFGVLGLVGAATLLAQPTGTPSSAPKATPPVVAPANNPNVTNPPATNPTANADAPATGFLFKTLIQGDKAYRYVVYVPREYAKGTPMPAIVFLHGSGECGVDGSKMIPVGIGPSLLKYPERWQCIVVIPQKPEAKKQWEEYDAQVMAMLEATKQDYTIDENRIGLTGLSQGGHGTWMLAAAHPTVWCAIAPVCGYSQMTGQSGPESAVNNIVPRIKGIPVWCFHGDMDDVVSPSQSTAMVEAIRVAGGGIGSIGGIAVGGPMLKFTRYPGTKHNCWDKAYAEDDLPEFLMTARKKK